ncbi:hypothetical protein WJX73_000964 [Symbiochloris irregularis]|uniref:Exonuclease 1 n=1 Tax=Symbiochloris irregularis TaxID=706552 RepID=A0AAW1NQT6_9CHLO
MGISGLHPVLRPYLREIHVSEYRGRRVGCDALAWLHRGACARADSLVTAPPGQTDSAKPPPWLDFALNMVRMLLDNGVTPVVVFDGAGLPAKAATQQARRERKREALEKAQQAAARGDKAEAHALISQTVDVTAEMAHELVKHLRTMGVEFLVAPYEADSQLAFLAGISEGRAGIAAVITEDSDLVPYGCARTLFKCDRSGCALELRLEDLFSGPPSTAAPEMAPASSATAVSFRHFTLEMLQAVCVLAGCDFLPSVKGVGVHKAHKLIKRYRMLSRAITLLKDDRHLSVPRDYAQSAQAAVRCFRHALVFDPSDGGGSLVRLAPLPAGVSDKWLEPCAAPHIAKGIAYGYLHPTTHARFPAASSGKPSEGGSNGWMKTASKNFSPYTPSIRVSQPLTAQQKAAMQPQIITIQEDHNENLNQNQQQMPSTLRILQRAVALEPAANAQLPDEAGLEDFPGFQPALERRGDVAASSSAPDHSPPPAFSFQRMDEPCAPLLPTDAAAVITVAGPQSRIDLSAGVATHVSAKTPAGSDRQQNAGAAEGRGGNVMQLSY